MKIIKWASGAAAALCIGLAASSAHAAQYVDVIVKGAKGPVAICIGTLEEDRIFAGYVSQNGRLAIGVPESRALLKEGQIGIIVTGSNGTVRMTPPKETLELEVDMRRAETSETRCNIDNALDVKEGNAAFFEGAMRKAEKLDSEIFGKTSPELLIGVMKQQQRVTLERHLETGVTAIVRGEFFEAIAEEQRRREDAKRASEMVERIMAAFVARAEEVKREREADRRRKRENAEREWRRKEAEAETKAREEASEDLPEAPKGEACFGAVGQGCKPLSIWVDGVKGSTCVGIPFTDLASCWVNSGSWAHDECCVQNPNGVMCGGNDRSDMCQAEWDHAWDHTAGMLYTWSNTVDTTILDYDGKVDHDKFCAPFAQIVAPREGTTVCCSKKALQLSFVNPLTGSWVLIPDVCEW